MRKDLGLHYRDSREDIESRINQSFHLFRNLLIIISGRDAPENVLDVFYEKAERVYQTAREIISLQSSDSVQNYAFAHVKTEDVFYFSLLESIRGYNPGVSDPILEIIYDLLVDNHVFVIARPMARKWNLNLINTQTSLDIISEGIENHKSRRDKQFHLKYKYLLPDY